MSSLGQTEILTTDNGRKAGSMAMENSYTLMEAKIKENGIWVNF